MCRNPSNSIMTGLFILLSSFGLLTSSLAFSLSSRENCDTTPSILGDRQGFQVGSKYQTERTRGCSSATVHDMYAYNGVPYPWSAPGDIASHITYGEGTPKNKKDCEKIRIAAYAWELGENLWDLELQKGEYWFEWDDEDEVTPIYLGGSWRWAEWIDDGFCLGDSCFDHSYCVLPTISLEKLGLVDGRDYRFAFTARKYSRPRDSKSRFSLREYKFIYQSKISPPR